MLEANSAFLRKAHRPLDGFRSFLYWLGNLLGDISAVNKGRVGRGLAGNATGRGLGKLFR